MKKYLKILLVVILFSITTNVKAFQPIYQEIERLMKMLHLQLPLELMTHLIFGDLELQ